MDAHVGNDLSLSPRYEIKNSTGRKMKHATYRFRNVNKF